MPRYEYRCRTCGDTFELNRPMAQSATPASCPAGHDDTVKLLSTVAVAGVSRSTAPAPAPQAGRGGGGGCCGGGCCG
ncbi:zinc ribbon domain-containing protein [Streptomyces sp. NPDC100445]|uniref:FmdB family zinc ribbon protein n=1 Tax=Streptomyces sp. NPDC100445 TaxID=3366102 RepID=UPI0038127963